jgi:hypothetical protein
MARPTGPVAIAAWRKFAAAREAHYLHGAPASTMHAAADELNRWAETVDECAGADFGNCPDLPELELPDVELDDIEFVYA